jgi:hypothetical protein
MTDLNVIINGVRFIPASAIPEMPPVVQKLSIQAVLLEIIQAAAPERIGLDTLVLKAGPYGLTEEQVRSNLLHVVKNNSADISYSKRHNDVEWIGGRAHVVKTAPKLRGSGLRQHGPKAAPIVYEFLADGEPHPQSEVCVHVDTRRGWGRINVGQLRIMKHLVFDDAAGTVRYVKP